MGRDVPFGTGTREGLFRIVHTEEEAFPDAELLFIEHATRDVLWQPPLLEHANGVVGLAGITICSNLPEETAAHFERCTGLGGKALAGRPHFTLAEGYVAIAPRTDLAERYPDAILPAVPSVGVVELTVASVDETRKLLRTNDVTAHDSKRGIWVRPERTGGVILEFVEA